jgi:hypothetical protein
MPKKTPEPSMREMDQFQADLEELLAAGRALLAAKTYMAEMKDLYVDAKQKECMARERFEILGGAKEDSRPLLDGGDE